MQILIVEDNTEMRETIKNLLVSGDIEFHEAADGMEGVEIYKRANPDWVVMDIKMKRMNGIEAAKKIILHDPEANIVIITNFDTKYYRKAALDAGAKYFLSKLDLNELKNRIFVRYENYKNINVNNKRQELP